MKDILLATIPATIPTLAVLVGILLNQVGLNRLEARINAMGGELVALRKQLHDDTSALRKQLYDDIVLLVGRDPDKSERLARLEERSNN